MPERRNQLLSCWDLGRADAGTVQEPYQSLRPKVPPWCTWRAVLRYPSVRLGALRLAMRLRLRRKAALILVIPSSPGLVQILLAGPPGLACCSEAHAYGVGEHARHLNPAVCGSWFCLFCLAEYFGEFVWQSYPPVSSSFLLVSKSTRVEAAQTGPLARVCDDESL